MQISKYVMWISKNNKFAPPLIVPIIKAFNSWRIILKKQKISIILKVTIQPHFLTLVSYGTLGFDSLDSIPNNLFLEVFLISI